MPNLTLEQNNRTQLAAMLADDKWVIACLCAAWCDSCGAYRATFDTLAARHPELGFVWIDIEDQADLVGDLDVENFPTLLMQKADVVAFFGSVQPDLRIAERLLLAQIEKTAAELQYEANHSEERQQWQTRCNLRQRMRDASSAK